MRDRRDRKVAEGRADVLAKDAVVAEAGRRGESRWPGLAPGVEDLRERTVSAPGIDVRACEDGRLLERDPVFGFFAAWRSSFRASRAAGRRMGVGDLECALDLGIRLG